MKITGFILMIVGLGLSIFTAFSFFTKEKVVDLGAVEISRDVPHAFNWSPFVGLAIMVIGAFLVLWARKKS